MIFSKKMASLSSAIFSELNYKKVELMAQGYQMIDFSIGTPDISPAPQVIERLQEECGQLSNYKYAIHDTPELLEAVITWYARRYGVDLTSEEVVSL